MMVKHKQVTQKIVGPPSVESLGTWLDIFLGDLYLSLLVLGIGLRHVQRSLVWRGGERKGLKSVDGIRCVWGVRVCVLEQ